MKISRSDVSFSELNNNLNNFFLNRKHRELNIKEYRRAAVFILFINNENSPCVLLTKRSNKLKSHTGQVAFPGGAYDESDSDILETAYRETFEETGISKEFIDYIGRYDDYISIAGFNVSCFVGIIPAEFKYNFSVDEIEDYLEPSFLMFLNREYDRTEQFFFEGKNHNVYYYYYKDFEIWGMTARILTDLGEELKKVMENN